jgi:hypothetical protein
MASFGVARASGALAAFRPVLGFDPDRDANK